MQDGLRKGGILHLDSLEGRPTNGEVRQIQTKQMPAKLSQQRQQIRRSIALSGVFPLAKSAEQCKEVFLEPGAQRVGVAQARQNGDEQEALLGLPYIFLAGSQFQPMFDQM